MSASFNLLKTALLLAATTLPFSAGATDTVNDDSFLETAEDCKKPAIDMTDTKYTMVTCLHQGVSVFGIKDELDNNYYGLINAKGEEVTPPEYRAIRYFSDGFLRVYKGNKKGIISTTGKVVLPIIYDHIGLIHDGYAEILIAEPDGDNVKKGLVNQKGQVVIAPKYYEIVYDMTGLSGLDSDVLAVSIKEDDNIEYGLISFSDEVVVPLIYDDILGFSAGWARACQDKRCNFINTKGELLLPYWADNVGVFNESKAWVKHNGRYGYIDASGQVVIPFLYDSADFFKNGRAIVSYNPENLTQKHSQDEEVQSDTYGLIDTDNNTIVPFKYQKIRRINPNLFYVENSNGFSFLDNDGNLATTKNFDNIVFASIFNELLAVKREGKWGYINHEFETVVPFEYQKAIEFEEDLAAVKRNNKFGFIDKKGQTAIPFEYDDPNIDVEDWRTSTEYKYRFYSGMTAVRKNGYWGVIDKDNNIIVPFEYDDVVIESFSQIKATKNGVDNLFDEHGSPIEDGCCSLD